MTAVYGFVPNELRLYGPLNKGPRTANSGDPARRSGLCGVRVDG